MAIDSGFAVTFASLGAANASAQFEEQFRQLQNTVIRRLNTEIAKANSDTSADHAIEALNSKVKKLQTAIPVYDKYIFDNTSNFDKMQDINTTLSNLRSQLKSDGDDTTVSADEAASFNKNKADVVDALKNLQQLYHPEITDANVIRDLRNLADTLDGYTASAGSVDAEGTADADATNDNRAIYDILDTLNNRLGNAVTTTQQTIYSAVGLREAANSKVVDIQAQQLEVGKLAAEQKTQEIEDLKAKYSQVLYAISVSYETASQATAALNLNLSGTVVQTGSIVSAINPNMGTQSASSGSIVSAVNPNLTSNGSIYDVTV